MAFGAQYGCICQWVRRETIVRSDRRHSQMIKAYTAVDTAAGTSQSLCEKIRNCSGVTEAHVVAGEFDIMVELTGKTPRDILHVVTADIRPSDGVGTTRTYICLDEA